MGYKELGIPFQMNLQKMFKKKNKYFQIDPRKT